MTALVKLTSKIAQSDVDEASCVCLHWCAGIHTTPPLILFRFPSQHFVSKPFPYHARCYVLHLPDHVHLTDIVFPCKLHYIAIEVFLAEFVIHAFMGTLDHSPKRLNTIGMSETLDVFLNGIMLDSTQYTKYCHQYRHKHLPALNQSH